MNYWLVIQGPGIEYRVYALRTLTVFVLSD